MPDAFKSMWTLVTGLVLTILVATLGIMLLFGPKDRLDDPTRPENVIANAERGLGTLNTLEVHIRPSLPSH
jgi:hypothetical protein